MFLHLSVVRRILAGLVLFVVFVPPEASSQSTETTRATRQAALERMIADPTDQQAMLTHARSSIALREFEPAVSTLERLLDLYPNDVSARFELAISYFALGAYSVSDLHFARLEQVADLDPKMRRSVAQYRQAIADRTATSGFSGHFAVGAAYSTNATLQSDSPVVFSLGVPVTRGPGATPGGDLGGTVSARVQHRYDMGLPSGDLWFTELGLEALHFVTERDGDFDGLFLRTGPSLSLNQFAYGPKLRPFVEVDTIFSGADWLYSTVGAGLQYNNSLTAEWSIYGSVRSGYRWHTDTDSDGAVQRAVAGVVFRPSRDFTVRLSGLAALDTSASEAIANMEFGARLGADYDFDSEISFAERKWRLSAYGQIPGSRVPGSRHERRSDA